MGYFLQLVVDGTVQGSMIALGAIGVSMIFSILRFAHFAHGDFMTVGAYLTLAFGTVIGLPLWSAAPLAMIGAGLVAIALELLVYRRLRRSSPLILLIASFGLALVLRSAIQIIWGPDNQTYGLGLQMAQPFGPVRIKPDHFWIVGWTIVMIAALHVFLQYTKFGKAMRAMADNMDLARISGIPVERVILVTWLIVAALAAAAGFFSALDTRLHPVMGFRLLLPVFAAAILGGIGRPYGAIAGGFSIGIAMEVSTMVIDPAYKQAVAFVIMVTMLIIRPTGLFAGKQL